MNEPIRDGAYVYGTKSTDATDDDVKGNVMHSQLIGRSGVLFAHFSR